MIMVLASLWNSRYRRQLIATSALLALALALAAGMLLWATNIRAAAQLERESQTSAWDASSVAALEISHAAANLPVQLRAAASLRAAGFAAAADRVAWVEHTLAQLRSIEPLDYSVVAGPAEVQPVPEPLQSWFFERGLEAPVFETNDMEIQAQGLVESELLLVLQEAIRAGGAITRTENCKLSRRADGVGIDAECKLRRYRLKKQPPEASS